MSKKSVRLLRKLSEPRVQGLASPGDLCSTRRPFGFSLFRIAKALCAQAASHGCFTRIYQSQFAGSLLPRGPKFYLCALVGYFALGLLT